jgi:hypothetical protein
MALEIIPADTTPEAARVHLMILRRMSPERRMELVCQLSDGLREVVSAGVRHRHPEYAEDQVRLAVLRIYLGDSLFRQVRPGVEIAV